MKRYRITISLLMMLFLLTGCTIFGQENIEQVTEVEAKSENVIVLEEQTDMKVLSLYCDSSIETQTLNKLIKDKIMVDSYSIESEVTFNIDDYDLILIGTSPINNHPCSQMTEFLCEFDFKGKYVSNYWVGTVDNDQYETIIKQKIKNAKILPGIGFNGDEISEVELVSQTLDGWLTSVNQPSLI